MATIIVDTADDIVNATDGVTSLREAITLAEGTIDNDTIVFDAALAGQDINLQSTLVISVGTGTAGTLTIDGDTDGDGDPDLVISGDSDNDGNGDVSLLSVSSGADLTLESLTLADGYVRAGDGYYAPGESAYSAITNAGTLSINDSVISNNTAIGGDGFGRSKSYQDGTDGGRAATIGNSGTLTITNSIFDDNTASGGDGGFGSNDNLGDGFNGGNGGAASAGVMNTGTVALDTVLFYDGTATGGDGGNGGDGGSFGGVIANGGNGGNNGGASGGIFNIGSGASVSGTAGTSLFTILPGGVGSGGGNGSNGSNLGTGSLNLTIGGASSTLGDISSGFANGTTSGDDTIMVDNGLDTINGMAGDDTISAGYSVDDVFGGTGNDTIIVTFGQFFDNVDGGQGTDTLDHSGHYYEFGADTVDFAAGQMTFNSFDSGPQTVTLSGIEVFSDSNNGNNIIADDMGMIISGNGGDDTIVAGAGADSLNGGIGDDTLSFENSASGVVVNLSINSVEGFSGSDSDAQGDFIAEFENVIGSAFTDRFFVTGMTGKVIGGGGDDRFDLVDGTTGIATVISGGSGTDTIVFGVAINGFLSYDLTSTTIRSIEAFVFEDPFIDGTQDVFLLAEQIGGNGLSSNLAVEFDGFLDTRETIHIDLGAITSLDLSGWTFSEQGTGSTPSFLNITGSAAADGITGSSIIDTIDSGNGADTVFGGAGDDLLSGGRQGDSLYGGADNDVLIGFTGDDLLDGGDGIDTASFADLGSSVSVSLLVSGAQAVSAAGGNDTLVSIENLIGSKGADTLTGDNGDNVIDGFLGNDLIFGLGGDDVMMGGVLNDVLRGNNGNDTLIGGDGRDVLGGGSGADTFVFENVGDSVNGGFRDRIQDFDQGVDKIDLSQIAAAFGTLEFIDALPFGFADDGAIRAFQVTATNKTIVALDVDGDNIQDMQIELTGLYDLTVDDFVLS